MGGGGTLVSPEILPDTPRPAPLPPGIRPAALLCGQTSLVERSCGHTCLAPCREAFAALEQQCREEVEVMCDACHAKTTAVCSTLQGAGRLQRCLNKVDKCCTICGINRVAVECYRCVLEAPACPL